VRQLMFGFITFVRLVAGLASALTGQPGFTAAFRHGARWRDFTFHFAYVSPRYSTPTRAIYLMAAVTLVGSLLIHFELAWNC